MSEAAIATPETAGAPTGGHAYWREAIKPYEGGRLGRSLLDLATSVVPYLALSVLMYLALDVSYWLVLALAVPTAGFLLRSFIVFHDCAHGSFLPWRRGNLWLGRVTAFLVATPFAAWRHDHAMHHATSGDLDRRGDGDVPTMTLAEYRDASWLLRLGYRLFRNPIVMFGLGWIYALVIGPRLINKDMRPRIRNSILLTNLALVIVIGGLCWLLGWQEFLLVWGPPVVLAGSSGVWLFYVQHQFEDVYWETHDDWNFADAALQGSSYLKLPKILQFFTGNIGLHHVHHLSAKVPNYNLQRAVDETPMFQDVPTLTLRDGLKCSRWKLYDEERGRLITWAEARAPRAVALAEH